MNLCLATNSLPGPGGLLDQDEQWVNYIRATLNVHREVEDQRAKLEQARERAKRGPNRP